MGKTIRETEVHYSLDALIHNEHRDELIQFYSNATDIWNRLRLNPQYQDIDWLSNELRFKQREFEQKCGGKTLGQEIMVAVGIVQFYRVQDGFGTRIKSALHVYNAIKNSSCSLEVKGHNKRIAESYGLLERSVS